MSSVYYAAAACIAFTACATDCAEEKSKSHAREERPEWTSPPPSPSGQIQAPPTPPSPRRVPTPPPIKNNEPGPTS